MTEFEDEEQVSYWPSVGDLFMTLFIIALVMVAVVQLSLRPRMAPGQDKELIEAVGGLEMKKIRDPVNRMRHTLGTQTELEGFIPAREVVAALSETANAVCAEISETRTAMGPAYARLTGPANLLRGKLGQRPLTQVDSAETAVQSVEMAAADSVKNLRSILDELVKAKAERDQLEQALGKVQGERDAMRKQLVAAETALNDKPPIIQIKEADGKIYRFPSGSATLSSPFKNGLTADAFKILAAEILKRNANNQENVDTLEIIGHTDGDPVSRHGNLDHYLPDYLAGVSNDVSLLSPGSNNDLGLLRALAVRQAWAEFVANQENRSILQKIIVRCYSAGQTVPESTQLHAPATYRMQSEQFRRIEMRLTKLKGR